VVLDVELGQVAVAEVDATLEVDIVGRHIVGADAVIDAAARSPHRGHDEVTRPEFGHVRADGFDLAEVLVADDQEVVALRRLTVLGGVDLLVRAVDAALE
jgi:hypothetical protein